MGQQLFNYYLFGIYIIELGRFLKGTFSDFVIEEGGDPIRSQVFFGTPRAAFRYYMETYNGLIDLPMINYYITGAERKIGVLKPMYMPAHDSYNEATGKMDMMRFPSVFEITYTINIWNNSLRERDFMMHTIINSFPEGEAWLIHYPDQTNMPDVWLPMPHTLENTFTDATDVEDLEASETRDRIRTTLTLKCTRAFVPYQVYQVPVATWVQIDSYINDMVLNNRIQVAAPMSATAVVLGGEPDKTLHITREGDTAEIALGTPSGDTDLSISRIGTPAEMTLSGEESAEDMKMTGSSIEYALLLAGSSAAQIDS